MQIRLTYEPFYGGQSYLLFTELGRTQRIVGGTNSQEEVAEQYTKPTESTLRHLSSSFQVQKGMNTVSK